MQVNKIEDQLSLQITHFIENNRLILTTAQSTKTSVKASPYAVRSPTDSFLFIKKYKRTNPIASADYLVPAIVGARTLYR